MSNYILTDELINKFHSRYEIDSDTGCWIWKGTKTVQGHPYIQHKNEEGKLYNAFASKIAYQLENEVTDEVFKLEKNCGNKLCVNPKHIYKIQNKKKLGITESSNKCKIEGCEKPRRHRDTEMCDQHHRRFLQFGDAEATPLRIRDTGTLEERFHKKYKIDENTGCWLWQGSCQGDGYGNIQNGKQNLLAHRVSYELFYKDLTPELKVLHTCDVRTCVNPKHLFLGTDQDNTNDKMIKGRHRLCSIKDLTSEEILEIRTENKLRNKDIAQLYDVSVDMVNSIKKRRVAKWLTEEGKIDNTKLPFQELTEIQAYLIKNSNLSNLELAGMFDKSNTAIWEIKSGSTWKDLPIGEDYLRNISSENLLEELSFLSKEDFEKFICSLFERQNSTTDSLLKIPLTSIRVFFIKASTLKPSILSRMFHISSVTVHNIKTNKVWSNVLTTQEYFEALDLKQIDKELYFLSNVEFNALLDSLKFGENIELNKTTQPI